METLRALDIIHATVESITFPFLIMHGTDDSIVSLEVS
jgi:pimeloyl-ACP methyl ester carboxylesterase